MLVYSELILLWARVFNLSGTCHLFSFPRCCTDKKYAFRCSRCGSAIAPLLRWKMNPPHLYLLSSSASSAFSPPSHMYVQLALLLHPRGRELQRPLLPSCFSHSFRFLQLLSSFVVLLCSWHSLTPLPFSGFLKYSLRPPQRYPQRKDWKVLTEIFRMNIGIRKKAELVPLDYIVLKLRTC